MAQTLTTRITTALAATATNILDMSTSTNPMTLTIPIVLASGTTTGKADVIFQDRRTLNASTSETLDLAGGSLTGPLGDALTFVKIKAIIVSTVPPTGGALNTNDVVLGGIGSNAFVGPFGATTHTIAVPPGSVTTLTNPGAGWTVTAATGDLLKVLNGGSGTTVTYDIVIVGTSA
jgi:hypothetical protein